MSEQFIWKYLKDKGYSEPGVAGIMGNLYAESGLKSNNLQNYFNKKLNLSDEEYTKQVDNGTYSNFIKDNAGYGLAQWTYWSRKQNLLDFAKKQKVSISDLKMQLDFLDQELTTKYKNLSIYLKKTNNISEASNHFLLEFERPANQSLSIQKQRASYAKNYYIKYSYNNQKKQYNGKYSDQRPPLVCFQTNSTCYKSTKEMKVVGILWHSTGANNPALKRYIQPLPTDNNYNEMLNLIGQNNNKNDYNHIHIQSGLNAWIGKDSQGIVRTIQTMPWTYRPWGCGSGKNGSCNNGWIQFEICEDSLNNEEYFNQIYKEACELTAYLCQKFNINPYGTVNYNGILVPTILCHADSYKLGLGSNHSDIYHWFSRYGKNMEAVKEDVVNIINKKNNILPQKSPIENNKQQEEEEMTQEQFNKMMNVWIAEQAKKDPGDWSIRERTWAEQEGLVKGNSKGQKMYKKPITREEFIVVLHRALHRYFI